MNGDVDLDINTNNKKRKHEEDNDITQPNKKQATDVEINYKEEIIKILNKYGYHYREIGDDASMKIIYDIFKNKKAAVYKSDSNNNYDSIVYVYLAIYYDTVEKNESAYIESITIAHSKKNKYASCLLGNNYKSKGSIDIAFKYYEEGSELMDQFAMNNLAIIYDDKNDKDNAEKYYMAAISLNNPTSMFNFGMMYKDSDTEIMIYYLEMAANLNECHACLELVKYYKGRNEYDKMIKYLDKAAMLGDIDSIEKLVEWYIGNNEYDMAKKYIMLGIEKNNKVCIWYFNNKLEDNFNINVALEHYNVLNKKK